MVICASLLVSALIVEAAFRILERSRRNTEIGDGCWIVPDARWGWRLPPGTCAVQTFEFTAHSSNNSLSMNDEPFVAEQDLSKTRVLALGDSHTQAIGVNTTEAWPKVLQRSLEASTGEPFRVYNSGTAGYSLHQYLLRLIDQGSIVKPDYVVVGLSLATDLFDLLPPERGGWAYFGTLERDYFDFNASGELTARHWSPQPAAAASALVPNRSADSMFSVRRVRQGLEHVAMFRYLRHSSLALTIGATVRIGGQSLWPNMDAVLERDISPEHEYNWRLAFALLDRINAETKKLHAQLVVLIIPYLPQVYDDTWQSTFGTNPRYSRTASIDRLQAWLASRGIPSVDTTPALRAAVTAKGHWLHYRYDAHPTAEGQAVIASELMRQGVIRPRLD
jgi:lysophospholipase L1-like esterase